MSSKIRILAENLARAALSGFCNSSRASWLDDMTQHTKAKAVEAVYKMLREEIMSDVEDDNIGKDNGIVSGTINSGSYPIGKFDPHTQQCNECGMMFQAHSFMTGDCPS